MKNIYFVSGGKDSTAMLIHALELGWNVDQVQFLDTTMEFPELYAYLDKVDSYIADYGIKIDRIQTAKNRLMKDFIKSGKLEKILARFVDFHMQTFQKCAGSDVNINGFLHQKMTCILLE